MGVQAKAFVATVANTQDKTLLDFIRSRGLSVVTLTLASQEEGAHNEKEDNDNSKRKIHSFVLQRVL